MMDKELRQIIEMRRAVRRFEADEIPQEILNECLDLALLAPNSSNLQPWEFYVVKSSDKKKQMVEACLGQNAAKTAPVLIAIVGRTKTWKAHSRQILDMWPEGEPPQIVKKYYTKTVRLLYNQGFLGLFGLLKYLISFFVGWKKSYSKRSIQRSSHENLVGQNLLFSGAKFDVSTYGSRFCFLPNGRIRRKTRTEYLTFSQRCLCRYDYCRR